MIKRNAERMQYQTDKLSYWLCTLSIILNMVYFVSIYTNRDVTPDVAIGADVLINIIFMMIVFLASEKLKSYEKKWNIYIILVGVLQMLRIFLVPMHYKQLEMLVGKKYLLSVIWLLTSGILLLLAGINSSINSRILSKYESDNGVGG